MGETLSTSTDGAMLSLLRTRQEAKCAPVVEPPVSLVPTHGEGFTGAPGLEVFGQHDEWSAGFETTSVVQQGLSVTFTGTDEHRNMTLVTKVVLDENSSIATYQSTLTNNGAQPVNLAYLNAASLILPMNVNKIKTFEGRWSNEFQTADHDLFFGSYV
jgi:alpha-galactosidase|tara:strand:- start:4091 stop:4564 length:474 start_codon:yes stop_codon:yes gene_type:complete